MCYGLALNQKECCKISNMWSVFCTLFEQRSFSYLSNLIHLSQNYISNKWSATHFHSIINPSWTTFSCVASSWDSQYKTFQKFICMSVSNDLKTAYPFICELMCLKLIFNITNHTNMQMILYNYKSLVCVCDAFHTPKHNTRIVYMPKLSLNNLTAISVIYMSLKL